PGHWLGGGMDVCGRLAVRDIGIPAKLLPEDVLRLADASDAARALPVRKRTAHKNDFGHLLIVAGSRGMAGAAAMCTRAALRAGAGLTTVACPESCLPILQTLAPEAMCIPLPETDGALNADAVPPLRDALRGKTAVAAGCGLSMRASGECVRAILESGLPAVLDADALNLIAQDASLRQLLHSNCALTPHPGEAARLNGGMLPTMEAAARLRALGPAVLLKGACSLIVGDGRFLSVSGSVGMAKGGSGDALTGIVGALLAQRLSPTAALWLGSELHGRAGELAAAEKGAFSMLPTDLIEALPRVFLSLEELRR
ncbi:MAG: NAD(P)H-hydrate dehydratase, partial [Clostridia bacterium]|nr:NAD(P)H-hydrate dehydratase [Clostridia bacterium]